MSSGELVILVPYRDRLQHLQTFVPHMERFLKDQSFRILVVEQTPGKPFNRGAILNAGYLSSVSSAPWVVFHDVDMLPLDHNCDYGPCGGVRHLAGAAEQYGFKLPYANYIGGVLASSRQDFEKINGYSNQYWGWGHEDDDLFLRYWLHGISVHRVPGRYASLSHDRGSARTSNNTRCDDFVAAAAEPVKGSAGARLPFWESDPTAYVPRPEAKQFCIQDGLSTLNYQVLSRKSLRAAGWFGPQVSDRHEVITVDLN